MTSIIRSNKTVIYPHRHRFIAVILGAGVSGQSCARLVLSFGYKVVIIDDFKNIDDIDQDIANHRGFYGFNINNIDLTQAIVLKSPGISTDHKFYRKAININGCRVISIDQYGISLLNKPYVVVTGTNGKSTICKMIENIFQCYDLDIKAIGNIGTPIAQEIFANNQNSIGPIGYIIELSSYQLTDIDFLNPFVSVISNIANDHIEYHQSFANYFLSKWKVVSCGDYFKPVQMVVVTSKQVINTRNNTKNNIKNNPKKNYNLNSHGIKLELYDDYYLYLKDFKEASDNQLIASIAAKSFAQSMLAYYHHCKNYGQIPLTFSPHILSKLAKINNLKKIIGLIADQKDKIKLAHRLEDITYKLKTTKAICSNKIYTLQNKLSKLRFINDSKATNLHAVCYALSSFSSSEVILIIGGKSKMNDNYHCLIKYKDSIKKIYIFGTNRDQIGIKLNQCGFAIDNFHNSYKDLESLMRINSDLVQYIIQALTNKLSKNHDLIVLFSPGGESFDQFQHYAHRGQCFEKLTKKLYPQLISSIFKDKELNS